MTDKHWDHDGDDRLHHMMKDAFDNRRQQYQDHRDAKIHYLARSGRIHSWERPDHQTRRFESEYDNHADNTEEEYGHYNHKDRY